jgi:hypothetical protein
MGGGGLCIYFFVLLLHVLQDGGSQYAEYTLKYSSWTGITMSGTSIAICSSDSAGDIAFSTVRSRKYTFWHTYIYAFVYRDR